MIPERFKHKEFLCLRRDNNIDDSFIAVELHSLRENTLEDHCPLKDDFPFADSAKREESHKNSNRFVPSQLRFNF